MKRGTRRRDPERDREQKATTMKSMGKRERRMGMGMDLGEEGEREQVEGQGNNARLVDVGVSY